MAPNPEPSPILAGFVQPAPSPDLLVVVKKEEPEIILQKTEPETPKQSTITAVRKFIPKSPKMLIFKSRLNPIVRTVPNKSCIKDIDNRKPLKGRAPKQITKTLAIKSNGSVLLSSQIHPVPAIYQCPYCLCIFTKEFEFRFHMSQKLLFLCKMYTVKKIPETFECIECFETFGSHKEFTKHMSKVHPISIRCDICDEEFTYVCQLNKHQHSMLHFFERSIECTVCNVDFPNLYCLQSHNFICHNEVLFRCEICLKIFQNRNKMLRHHKLEHPTPSLDVNICQFQGSMEIVAINFTNNSSKVALSGQNGLLSTFQNRPVQKLSSGSNGDVGTSLVTKKSIVTPGTSLMISRKFVQGSGNSPRKILPAIRATGLAGVVMDSKSQICFKRNLPKGPLKKSKTIRSICGNLKLWPCQLCSLNFKTVDNFMDHWKSKHSCEPLPKWLSQMIFSADPGNVSNIFLNDLTIRKPKVNDKGGKSDNVPTAINGIPIIRIGKLNSCPKCEQAFIKESDLASHIETNHILKELSDLIGNEISGSNKVTCEVCSSQFENETLLNFHMNCKHQKTSYNCCDMNFENCLAHSNHMQKVHKALRLLECKLCNFSTFTPKEVAAHMQECHNQRLVHCVQCNKQISLTYYLQHHLTDCSSEDKFVCPCCENVNFTSVALLKLHMIDEHLKKNPNKFDCLFCYNSYYSKFNLNAHIGKCDLSVSD